MSVKLLVTKHVASRQKRTIFIDSKVSTDSVNFTTGYVNYKYIRQIAVATTYHSSSINSIKALRVLMGTAVFKRSSLQIGRFLV